MQHTCPHCGAARELNAHDIPQQGMRLQCFNCFGTFSVSTSSPSAPQERDAQASSLSDDLFESRGGFGFDLGESPTPPKAPTSSKSPPPLPTPSKSPSQAAKPTLTPTFSGGEDLPEPVAARRPPLKVFSATPPPTLNERPPESPELFAVQSSPPESPELFAVQSSPPESPEFFAVQGRPPESPELFAVQGRPPESPELFATQGRPPESPELFAAQGRPPESPELFAAQGRPPESPELFATQSRTESPELFATQSRTESPELFATQSRTESPELKASGTIGALEFGGLNDLFDQEDEEVETLFDTSGEASSELAAMREQAPPEEATLLEKPGSASSLFNDQAVFSSGGMFDFGDRGFDFAEEQSDLGFGAEPETPEVTAEAPPESLTPQPPSSSQDLPIDAPPIMFEMGGEVTPSPEGADASADELMAIELEEDDLDDAPELDDDEGAATEEESSPKAQKSKPRGKSGLLLIALLAALIGYLITQKPELISDLIGEESAQRLGLDTRPISSGDNTYVRSRPVTQGGRGVQGVGQGSQQGDQRAQPQSAQTQSEQRGLGSNESTKASLRAISQAARGGQAAQSRQGQSAQPTQANTNPARSQPNTQKPTSDRDQTQAKAQSAWFSPLAAISAVFKGNAQASRHQAQLNTPSPLDTEGFNQASQKLKSADDSTRVNQTAEVGLGVLHFDVPGMIWRREVLNQAQSLTPEQAQTKAGEHALIATQLIYDVEGATERAIAVGHAQPRDAAAQELMGHAYLKRGQSYEAQRAFERSYKLDSSRVRAQQKFAELASRNGDSVDANRALKSLVKRGQGAPSVQRTLAEVNLSQGKPDEAFSWINNLMNTSPERLSSQDQAATLSTLVRALDQKIESAREASAQPSDEVEAQILDLERAQRDALTEIVKLNPDDQQSLDRLLRRDERTRNWKSALEQVQALRETSGDSATLMLKEVSLLKQLARQDKARALLEKTLKGHEGKPAVHLAEGDFYIDQRDYTKARAAFLKAQRAAPTDPEPTLALTNLLVREARAGEAQEFLERESAARPWSAQLHNGLGDLKLKIAQTSGQPSMFQEAEEAYNRALTIDPGLAEARVQRARAQLELNKPQQALADLKWLKSQGYSENLDFELGRAQQALGNGKAAQNYFKRVLGRDREHIEALRAMGSLKRAERKVAAAKKYYEDALAVNSRDPLTRYELGRIALKERDTAQAVEHLRIATEVKDQDPQLQYWYGRALEKQGDPNSVNNVREAYEKSAALLPKNVKDTPPELCDVHYRVGLVHSQRPQELNIALEDFSRASECSPKRADVWTRLAESYEKLGDRDQMMKHYQRALKQNRNYVPALLGTARALMNQIPPKTKEARSALNRAIKRDKKNAEAHFLLCKVTQSSSRRKARKYCKRYLKLAPKGRFASLAKEIIRSL